MSGRSKIKNEPPLVSICCDDVAVLYFFETFLVILGYNIITYLKLKFNE